VVSFENSILESSLDQTYLQINARLYTIIGDSVNRTARIESLCRELATDLVVSAELYDCLDEKSRAMFTGPEFCVVKGLRTEIKVYRCLETGLSASFKPAA